MGWIQAGVAAAVLIAGSTPAAAVNVPALVRDINQERVSGGSSPAGLIEFNRVAYFAATTGSAGRELWRSDGTAAGTWMVKDLCPGPCWSEPDQLAVGGGWLWFTARSAARSEGLWRSDGTAVGTTLVAGLGNRPQRVLFAASLLFFVGGTGAGNQLWRSDGTLAGTFLLGGITGTEAVELGGRLFYAGPAGSLWASDGQPSGTGMVHPVSLDSGTTGRRLVVAGGLLYFSASDRQSGFELWRSDGSAAGTLLVADLCPGVCGSSPVDLFAAGSQVYFEVAFGSIGAELWASDGTSAGTRLVADIRPGAGGSDPEPLAAFGGLLLFSADDGVSGRELWRSDGSRSGTFRLRDVAPGPASSSPDQVTPIGPGVVFTASESLAGRELWMSDAGPFGTQRMVDLRPGPEGSAPTALARIGSELFFAADDGQSGMELWRSSGAGPGGTVQVAAIQDANRGSGPEGFLAAGGYLYFAADDGVSGMELWRTDGSAAGTVQVVDLAPGPGGSGPHLLLADQGWLYFSADDGSVGRELWRSDGSAAGTTLVKDLCPGSCGGEPRQLLRFDDRLYLLAGQGMPDADALWSTDGTPGGTRRVAELGTVAWMHRHADKLLLARSTLALGLEPWRLPIGSSVPELVADLCPGSCSSLAVKPQLIAPDEERLFVAATDDGRGRDLYRWDARLLGPPKVLDFPGHGNGPYEFKSVGSEIYFLARYDSDPEQLWVTDGTADGTAILSAFPYGPVHWAPWVHGLSVLEDRIFVSAPAVANQHGFDPGFFVTSGRSAPMLLRAGWSGLPGALHGSPVAVAGRLWFTADDRVSGRELWRSDGTAAGTALVADLSPGETSGVAAPTDARTLAVWNGRLYLAGDDGGRGYEPWALDLDRPRARLLRNASIRSLDPLQPARGLLLPLEPARDAWRERIVPGDVDPEPGILRDRGRPLVFYALEGAPTLRMTKTAAGEVAAAW